MDPVVIAKEQSRAQAPGIFLPAFPDGADGSNVLKQGYLFKKSRDRALLSAIKFKSPWKRREFKVHESSRLQYWREDVLYGEIPSLIGAAIVNKDKSEADDKELAFEIQTGDENLLLYAETREDSSGSSVWYYVHTLDGESLSIFNVSSLLLLFPGCN